MSRFSGNFPHTRTDGRTHGKGSIYRTLPPKEVGPKIDFVMQIGYLKTNQLSELESVIYRKIGFSYLNQLSQSIIYLFVKSVFKDYL